MKYSKAKQPLQTPSSEQKGEHDLAIALFGYKNHAGIDKAYGFIRGWVVTSASAHDGAQLRNVVSKDNTASTVWANTAYRSKSNEDWLKDNGLKSDIHQSKPKGRPMPQAMLRANGRRSKIRSAIEHVFARQKDKMKLFIRTIGITRCEDQDWHGEQCLQHAPLCLPRAQTHRCMTPRAIRRPQALLISHKTYRKNFMPDSN